MPLAYIPSPSHAVWHFGPVPVRVAALFAVAGVILAIVIAERRYQAAGGDKGVIADIAAWAVPAGLIPAALGAFLAPLHGEGWQMLRDWDAAVGYPGAAALGTLAAWIGSRRIRAGQGQGQGHGHGADGGKPIRFAPIAGAVAPALAFGHAVADLGSWAAQEGYGQPSSLWWAVEISPAHRLSGYENFATFQPLFMYGALWDVTMGVAVIYFSRRLALAGDRVFALQAAAYGAGGFALFWLGIGHLPLVLGVRAGVLGDAVVLAGAMTYLARTRHRRGDPHQTAQKSPLERDAPLM